MLLVFECTCISKKTEIYYKSFLNSEMKMISKGKICVLSSALFMEKQRVIVLIP